VKTADGKALEATASFENAASVLFDAVVLPDGAAGVSALAAEGHAQEFVAHQYRHGKTLLALGASRGWLDKLGIAANLPSGAKDGGIVLSDGTNPAGAASAFIKAVGRHRHPERETDPPKV
jgi:catalase